jgi:hypothetical protein
MDYDLNTADQQRAGGELIPDGTIARAVMTIRPGGAGPDGILTASKSSDAQYLNCEFTVADGEFAKRKFWGNLTVSGGKLDDNGNSKGGMITRQTLRAIIESAYQIDPKDESPKAQSVRRIPGLEVFNGLEFCAEIGVEPAKGEYKPKNKLDRAVTPDRAEYGPAMGVAGAPVAPKAAPATKPAWTPPAAQAAAANGTKGAMPAWMAR